MGDYIYYSFSNSYPRSYNQSLVSETMYCYSDTLSKTEYNVSDGWGEYTIYYAYDYYYYYEFKKPNDARFLIMDYYVTSGSYYYLYVENTRSGRSTTTISPTTNWTTTIIIVCSVVGFLLLAVGGFFLWKYRHSISCECFFGLFSCLDCCNKPSSCDI